MRRFLPIFVLFFSGCATSSMTAYRDPQASGKSYSHLVVMAVSGDMQMRDTFETSLCQKLTVSRCTRSVDIAPPTRHWSQEELAKAVIDSGADGLLQVGGGDDRSTVTNAGYQTYSSTSGSANSSATVSGNTAYGQASGSSSTNSTTIPITLYNRNASARVELLDTYTGATAWAGEIQTGGQGLLGTTDSAIVGSQTSKIAAAMAEAGLLR